MRAIILTFFLIFIFSGCSTIEVAKQVNRATASIKTSINNLSKTEEENDNKFEEDNKNVLLAEQKIIKSEKKAQKAVVKKQSDNIKIKLIDISLNKLIEELGQPSFIRNNDKIKIARFDTLNCRLFVFFKLPSNQSKYFEIRNTNGNLIDRDSAINKCFKELKKV